MNSENVCVYCASSRYARPEFLDIASRLGTALAKAGKTVYFGGGATGLMGALADAVLAAGGRIVGVRPAFISGIEGNHPGVTDMIVTETMHQRKQIFYERSDAFVALPGAIGTLDELIETIMLKRLGLHNRPICVVNPGGFFGPLLTQLQRLVELDFVAESFLRLYDCAEDIPTVLKQIENHHPVEAGPIMWDQ